MHTRIFFAALAAGLLLTACGNDEDAAPTERSLGDTIESETERAADSVERAAENIGESLEETAENVGGRISEEASRLKARAVAAAEDRMTDLEVTLEKVEADLENASDEAKQAARPAVSEARDMFDAIGARINELKAAGAETWRDVSEDLVRAIDALQKKVSEAASKLGG